MNHSHDADNRSLGLGLASWIVGVVADLPLMPVLTLFVALLTPIVRRLGERLSDRMLGPTKARPTTHLPEGPKP